MPDHNFHHALITIATAPFRAGARLTIWRLQRRRCGRLWQTVRTCEPAAR
jgi:hypothetical protein